MRRRAAVVAALVAPVVAGALAGCSRQGEPPPGEARITDVRGVVEVAKPGGPWKVVDGGTVRRGERVRVRGTKSAAILALHGDAVLGLRGGSAVAMGTTPTLLSGDLLAEAGDEPLRVAGSQVSARLGRSAAARFARKLAFDVAVYKGRVGVTTAGRGVLVPALRQATIPAPGLVPPSPLPPLRYRGNDAWDRRFLLDAMQLGADLEDRSRGVSQSVSQDSGTTAGFYRLLIPDLERETGFDQQLLDGTDVTAPGERLVGAVIAAAGTKGDFASRWRGAFSFRQQGAEWGLVALDQGVRHPAALVDAVQQAIGRLLGPTQLASAPLGSVPGTGLTGSGVGAPAGDGVTGGLPSPPASGGETPRSDPGSGSGSPGGGSPVPGAPVPTVPGAPTPTLPPLLPTIPLPTIPLPTLPILPLPVPIPTTQPPSSSDSSGSGSSPTPTTTLLPPTGVGPVDSTVDTLTPVLDPVVDTTGDILGGLLGGK